MPYTSPHVIHHRVYLKDVYCGERSYTRFLIRRIGLRAEDGAFCDEMFYKQDAVGSTYGYAPRSERAI